MQLSHADDLVSGDDGVLILSRHYHFANFYRQAENLTAPHNLYSGTPLHRIQPIYPLYYFIEVRS